MRQNPFVFKRRTRVYDPGLQPLLENGRKWRRTRRGHVPSTVSDCQDARSHASPLRGGVVTHVVSLMVFFATVGAITQFYGSRTWRSMRFIAFRRRQSLYDTLVNKYAPDKRTIIAFGANFYGRRCATGESGTAPCRSLRRKFARCRRVVLINEYNTSKKSSCCGSPNVMLADRQVQCPTCGEQRDRDLNGALNITKCWIQHCQNGTRPAGLNWPEGDPWGSIDRIVAKVTWWNQLPSVSP